jgi:3-hydroxyisobutyrate dehydrogenase-like beta-hydroxyacid dehydrogenase
MQIAFLGLGIMGGPMARNLAKAGHQVTGWNRTPGKEIPGVKIIATPKEAAANAEVVWLCVSDTNAVEQLLFGPNGVHDSLRPGMIVVDSSTISPSASKRFAEKVQAKGARFVDAPITGSKAGAENGQLIFMVGGDEGTVAHLQPLFSAMGKSVVRVGEQGKGLAAKIGMNLIIALTYEGFAEALTLTRSLGVDPKILLNLINQSMVRSGVIDYKAPFVLSRDFSPNFPLRLMLKDMHLMLAAASEQNVQLPGLKTLLDVYNETKADGHENLDYAATLLTLEKRAKAAQSSTATVNKRSYESA